MRLFNIFHKKQPVDDTVAKSAIDELRMLEVTGSGIISTGTGNLYAPRADYDTLMAARAYQQIPLVHSCVNVIADLLSNVPLNVYMNDRSPNNRPQQKQTGYPYKMLEWVNPRMSKSLLIRDTVSWLLLDGNAYWVILPTPKKYANVSVLSIYPMEPQHVEIVPDPDTGERGYYYVINGEREYFTEDQVIHFRNFNPLNHWFGMGKIYPIDVDLQMERAMKKLTQKQFQNIMSIDGVLTSTEKIDDAEIRKLKRELSAQYGGTRNAHRVLVLDKGMDFRPIDPRKADEGITTLLNGPVADDASMVFGVPYGVLTGSGDSKLTDAEFLMWNKTIRPLGTIIAETLTKRLTQPISDRMYCDFDYSNVVALQLHDLDRTRVEVAHVNAGLRTPNEIRAVRNLPPYAGDLAEFGDTPTPQWKNDKQVEQAERLARLQQQQLVDSGTSEDAGHADPSLSLPGSEGGRDQSNNGEAHMVDDTGKR